MRGVVLAVAWALLAGGCGTRPRTAAPPPPVRGHADLDALVRHHPGWSGVAQFDRALARLAEAARRPIGAPPDIGLRTLPPESAAVPPVPALALDAEESRLRRIEQEQIARLRSRRALNRRRQLAQLRETWQREAQTAYERAVAKAQADYAATLVRLASERDARRVNLLIQIRALQRIVAAWNNSVPPTPQLNHDRAELARKQADLSALDAGQDRAVVEARAARDATVAEAARARDVGVQERLAHEESALRAQDEAQAATFAARLSAQRTALLAEVRSLRSASVAPAGPLGPLSLPPEAALPAGGAAETNLRAAESKLRAQRARWIAFLYDDTRAAALDVAGQRRWLVTFGPGRPGETDLTAPLADALTRTAWKG